MASYFIRRLLLVIPTFIGVTLLVFALTRLVPGGPIERMLAQSALSSAHSGMAVNHRGGGDTLSADDLLQLQKYYGFDQPVVVSYGHWLKNVMTFNLGDSTRYNEPVWDIIKDRLPVSIFYGLMTLTLTYAICIPLGIVKAIRHRTVFDNLSSALVFLGYAVPGYVIGVVLLTLFAAQLEWFPLGGFVSEGFEDLGSRAKLQNVLYHAVLPLLAYMAGSFALMTMLVKNSVLDNLAADYVRTAVAKGLSFRQAVFKHAVRNSMIPVATSLGTNIALILGGSFLIEAIFNIDGFGLLGFESLVERDYPVVMGVLVISSLLFMLGNIMADICVTLLDPRIRFGEAR